MPIDNNLTPLPLVMNSRINLDPVRQSEDTLTSLKRTWRDWWAFGVTPILQLIPASE